MKAPTNHDPMRKQQQIWHDEHTKQVTLPTMANVDPASGVVQFTDYLQDQGVKLRGKAVDIGAGKGRNCVHLAKLGYEVWALEYIKPAIEAASQLADSNKVSDKIHFMNVEIDTPWQFTDNFFDLAIDSFSSIDIETRQGRETCRDELFRTLRPRGYGLINVCSADDEWEKDLIANHPGPEPNSTIWPQNGKFQKDYDETELLEFYKKFEIIELKKISKPALKLGRHGTATNLWMVIKKP
jgi:SAM-dependent methyltransferase